MQDLIDLVLETVLRSVVWRTTWHLELGTLIIVGVIAFAILAYRRRRKISNTTNKRSKYRYRKRNIWKK